MTLESRQSLDALVSRSECVGIHQVQEPGRALTPLESSLTSFKGLRAILGFLSPGSQSVSSRSVEIAQLHVRAKSLQLFPAFCDPMDCSPPGPSVHGILQARTQEWVALPSSRGSSGPRVETYVSQVSCIGRRVLYH